MTREQAGADGGGALVARLSCVFSGNHEKLLTDFKQGGSLFKSVSWKDH